MSANAIQRFLVANDAFVIAALPQGATLAGTRQGGFETRPYNVSRSVRNLTILFAAMVWTPR